MAIEPVNDVVRPSSRFGEAVLRGLTCEMVNTFHLSKNCWLGRCCGPFFDGAGRANAISGSSGVEGRNQCLGPPRQRVQHHSCSKIVLVDCCLIASIVSSGASSHAVAVNPMLGIPIHTRCKLICLLDVGKRPLLILWVDWLTFFFQPRMMSNHHVASFSHLFKDCSVIDIGPNASFSPAVRK